MYVTLLVLQLLPAMTLCAIVMGCLVPARKADLAPKGETDTHTLAMVQWQCKILVADVTKTFKALAPQGSRSTCVIVGLLLKQTCYA